MHRIKQYYHTNDTDAFCLCSQIHNFFPLNNTIVECNISETFSSSLSPSSSSWSHCFYAKKTMTVNCLRKRAFELLDVMCIFHIIMIREGSPSTKGTIFIDRLSKEKNYLTLSAFDVNELRHRDREDGWIYKKMWTHLMTECKSVNVMLLFWVLVYSRREKFINHFIARYPR